MAVTWSRLDHSSRCTAYLERAATGFHWPCANKAHARCNHIDKLAYATIFARSPKCSDVGFIFKGLGLDFEEFKSKRWWQKGVDLHMVSWKCPWA